MQNQRFVSFFLAVLFSAVALPFFAQESLPPGQYTSSNKKALKFFSEGRRYYDARQDKKAEEMMKKAIEADELFAEPHVIIAILCLEQKRYAERVFHLRESLRKAPNLYVENYFNLAETEFELADFDNARAHYKKFISYPKTSLNDRDEAEFKIRCVDFAAMAMKNPQNVKFANMGPAINSAESEYFPSMTADEQNFLYTRRLPSNQSLSGVQEDLFLSRLGTAGQWGNAAPVRELSSTGNEGAPSISADGNYMFITMSQEMDGLYMGGQAKGLGSCDIFFTQKVAGRWAKPVNLGTKINSPMWESQPCFSSDGKTLYFVRGAPARNGTVKNVDIYYSVIGEDGKFSQAVKLPDNINTPKDEQSVFIHPDNQTLYFSSCGHVGLGGLDIFMSKRRPDGSWGDPVNLGYPINTVRDENSLLVSPSGRYGYFASEREGGFGELDIYQFEIPITMRPEKITYVVGKVYNAGTREPLEAAFELIDLETQKPVAQSYSQKNGEFLVTLTSNKNYLVNVSKEGYLFYSDNFSLKNKETDFSKPYHLDIPLEPLDTGKSVVLRNIFFDVNKWDLKPESKAELNKLVSLLQKNPTLKIEISGHTDNTGDKKANLTLSANRAKAVYDYLVNTAGIAPARLSSRGYGDTKPCVPNDTPENKAKNRRTEFKVLAR